ncbi:MAG: hypothetical protein M3003_05680 [Candidatus Dormibacteraeota bacterium]|nr:hypothetical protein [Candidatus Dormibacteraeota bacterium]
MQRHDSFEHRLLGDATPSEMKALSGGLKRDDRIHALKTELRRLELWMREPEKVTAADVEARWAEGQKAGEDKKFHVRVVTLPNGLVLTYGELNTLPDYLANPEAIRNAPKDVLLPILQSVRQEGYNRLTDLLNETLPFLTGDVREHAAFDKAAPAAGQSYVLAGKDELDQLNEVTKGLGKNKYQALVARNACHFAPFNWFRWREFHENAAAAAASAHALSRDRAKKKEGEQKSQEAWLNNGYADHFLQDAFAAGHLINKTLVMQWFVEWVQEYNQNPAHQDDPLILENWDKLQKMTSGQQRRLAGGSLYRGAKSSTDPQTAEEQATREQRIDASGVQASAGVTKQQAYENYLAFLNSAAVQKASGSVHDEFNEKGLEVVSGTGQAFKLYGDAHMLESSAGSEHASNAARASQAHIAELIATGTSSHSTQGIAASFPNKVRWQGEDLSLENWQPALRKYCFDHIFGPFVVSLIDTFGPHMGTVSGDISAPTPGAVEWGDTVIREWTIDQTPEAIGSQPVGEKIRMIKRLLEGWVSAEDVTAVQKICASVYTEARPAAALEAEMAQIRAMTSGDVDAVHNQGQRTQLRVAMSWNSALVRTPAGSRR